MDKTNPQIENIGYLPSVKEMTIHEDPEKEYDVAEENVYIGTELKTAFDKVCHLLKTSTTPRSLTLGFPVEAAHLQLLSEALAHNRSIQDINITIESAIDVEAFTNFATSTKNRPLKNLLLKIEETEDVLDAMKGIHIYTKNYNLEIYRDDNELYRDLIELLQTTNINRISCFQMSLFDFDDPISLTDNYFFQLCDYITKHDRLKEFSISHTFRDVALPYVINLIANAKSLQIFSMTLDKAPARLEELLDLLAVSNIKELYVSGPNEASPEIWLKIARSLRSMKKLSNLTVAAQIPDVENFETLLGESETITKCRLVTKGGDRFLSFPYQNIQLQNNRVRDLIILLFNLVRSPSAFSIIPRDLWPLIMSSVTIPGVSLDFGRIFSSVLKDDSIRRVIYKAVKKIR